MRPRFDMDLRSLAGPDGPFSREHRTHLLETYCRCDKPPWIDSTVPVRGDRRIEAGRSGQHTHRGDVFQRQSPRVYQAGATGQADVHDAAARLDEAK